MHNTLNPITSQLGTLDEISLKVESAKSDLHLAKVSLFADVFAKEIQETKNNSFFPILEITPFFNDDNDLTSIDTYIYFEWGDVDIKDRTVERLSSSVRSAILDAYHKMEMDELLLEVMHTLDMGSTLKSNSSFIINLNYDKDDIKERICKSFLTSEQFNRWRAITLESNLTSNLNSVAKPTKI